MTAAGPDAGDDGPAAANGGPPATELAFRPMRRSDVAALVALERRIFASPWDAPAFEAFLSPPPPFSRLALAADELAAYVLGWCAAGESELMNLAVAPEWRGRGVGRRLLEWALARCAELGARAMTLEVRASNDAALRLYRAHGFVEVGRRRAYYRRPREDALVLRADLAPAPPAPGPD